MENNYPYDNLWEEIPDHAFIALGRRGREQISLIQCFTPGCAENNIEKLHILSSPEKIIETKPEGNKVQKMDYRIKCDTCNSIFHLVFERYLEDNEKSTSESADDVEDSQVIFENVYATDDSRKTNYGQIGFVQIR